MLSIYLTFQATKIPKKTEMATFFFQIVCKEPLYSFCEACFVKPLGALRIIVEKLGL